jgi:hypothetical protein
MPSVPPRLEAIVGALLPPACREEVLGDLSEMYTRPAQYIILAFRTVPLVIVSRIRRTTDAYILLTEALLIYGSYLAGAWYTDRTMLMSQWGLLRLLIPTVLQVIVVILDHAWGVDTGWTMRLIQGSLMAISIYFNFTGGCIGVLLVAAVEILFRSGRNVPKPAMGPAPGLKPVVVSRGTKFFLAAIAVITVEAIIQAWTGIRPAIVGAFIIIVAVGFVLARPKKE